MKKVSKFLPLLIFLLTLGFLHSSAQSWQWAQSNNGNRDDYGIDAACSSNGDLYTVGNSGSYSITFGTTTLTDAASEFFFLVKYDNNGNIIWARKGGSSGPSVNGGAHARAVRVDNAGNVFVCGYFNADTLKCGSLLLLNTPPTSSIDIFLVKYDANGNELWLKGAVGNSGDKADAISIDGSGNIYMTGEFNSSTITFGTISINNTGLADVYLTKFDPNGNVIWAKGAFGLNDDDAWGVVADPLGNVFLTGSFAGSFSMGYPLFSAGNEDIFLYKFDTNGNFIWGKSAGGTGNENPRDIDLDPLGNIFITGGFSSPTITFNNSILSNTGTSDMFLAKYDLLGNALWGVSAGSSNPNGSNDFGFDVETDAMGYSTVGLRVDPPSITFGTITISNLTDAITALAKYDSNGNAVCADYVVNSGATAGTGKDALGNIYLTFGYGVSATVGTFTLPADPNGYQSYGIAKYIPCPSNGISEESEPNFTIFPSPSAGKINIRFNDPLTDFDLEIMNGLGEKILRRYATVDETNITIDLSDEPPGIYFIITKTHFGIFADKILIKR